MYKRIKVKCITSYDPYYGFKPIKQGEQVNALVLGLLTHIVDDTDRLLGVIDTSKLNNFFKGI
jgi:hypothetical protein